MIIERDERIEKMFVDTIQDNLFNKVRTGIHASDLLALKQAYWQRIKPLPPTKSEIIYWLSGLAHEAALLHITQFKHGKASQWENIWYTPDVFMGVPIEVKTSRRGFVVKAGKEAQQYNNYLQQLAMYCAAENSQEGWLIVWYLVMMDEKRRNTEPDFFAYKVNFTEGELEKTRKEMQEKRDLLTKALYIENVNILPDCDTWKCYKEISNMIEKPFCHTCNKEFQTDWGINKHITSKIGKGHQIKKGIYETIKKPRCKYIEWCKPELHTAWLQWKKDHPESEEDK